MKNPKINLFSSIETKHRSRTKCWKLSSALHNFRGKQRFLQTILPLLRKKHLLGAPLFICFCSSHVPGKNLEIISVSLILRELTFNGTQGTRTIFRSCNDVLWKSSFFWQQSVGFGPKETEINKGLQHWIFHVMLVWQSYFKFKLLANAGHPFQKLQSTKGK